MSEEGASNGEDDILMPSHWCAGQSFVDKWRCRVALQVITFDPKLEGSET